MRLKRLSVCFSIFLGDILIEKDMHFRVAFTSMGVKVFLLLNCNVRSPFLNLSSKTDCKNKKLLLYVFFSIFSS